MQTNLKSLQDKIKDLQSKLHKADELQDSRVSGPESRLSGTTPRDGEETTILPRKPAVQKLPSTERGALGPHKTNPLRQRNTIGQMTVLESLLSERQQPASKPKLKVHSSRSAIMDAPESTTTQRENGNRFEARYQKYQKRL